MYRIFSADARMSVLAIVCAGEVDSVMGSGVESRAEFVGSLRRGMDPEGREPSLPEPWSANWSRLMESPRRKAESRRSLVRSKEPSRRLLGPGMLSSIRLEER